MKPVNAVDGGLGRLGTLEEKSCEGALSVAIQTLTELTTYGKTYMMPVQTQHRLGNMNVDMRLEN